MKKMILPDDLESYRTKKIIKILLPFFVLLFLSVTACLLLSYKIPTLEHATPSKVKIVYAVLLVLPFIITGVPKKLIDRSWCGEIVSVDAKTYNSVYMKGILKQYTKVSVVLEIRLNNNKTITTEVFVTPEITDSPGSLHSTLQRIPHKETQQQITKYNAGDKVYHFYLFDHLLIENEKEQTVTCVVCGAVSPKESKKCAICDHSILHMR